MGKLLLVATGVALGAAVAIILSAREQLDASSMPAFDPQPRSPEAAPPGASSVTASV